MTLWCVLNPYSVGLPVAYHSCFKTIEFHRYIQITSSMNISRLPPKMSPEIIISFANSTKTRQNVAVVKRFVIAAVSRRRRRAQKRLIASVKVQRAWRRFTLRVILGRIVLATAATEVQLVNTVRVQICFFVETHV